MHPSKAKHEKLYVGTGASRPHSFLSLFLSLSLSLSLSCAQQKRLRTSTSENPTIALKANKKGCEKKISKHKTQDNTRHAMTTQGIPKHDETRRNMRRAKAHRAKPFSTESNSTRDKQGVEVLAQLDFARNKSKKNTAARNSLRHTLPHIKNLSLWQKKRAVIQSFHIETE